MLWGKLPSRHSIEPQEIHLTSSIYLLTYWPNLKFCNLELSRGHWDLGCYHSDLPPDRVQAIILALLQLHSNKLLFVCKRLHQPFLLDFSMLNCQKNPKRYLFNFETFCAVLLNWLTRNKFSITEVALSYRFYRLSLLWVCLIRVFKWRFFYHWISIRDSFYFTCCWTFPWWGIQRNGLAQSP